MTTQSNIHIGKLIKAVFDESGMTVTEFAKRIHVERSTVYSIFERSSTDVLQLARISLALKHNFLSDVEQHFELHQQNQSLTIHFDKLNPETAIKLTNLLKATTVS